MTYYVYLFKRGSSGRTPWPGADGAAFFFLKERLNDEAAKIQNLDNWNIN